MGVSQPSSHKPGKFDTMASQGFEWMALRVDSYTSLPYQQLVDERQLKLSDGLPPVLPIILYK